MSDFPPLMRDQRAVDTDHLRLLAIFHLVAGGLSLFGVIGLIVHYLVAREVINNPEIWKMVPNAPPPQQFWVAFEIMYAFLAFMITTFGVLNLISGLCIRARKYRMFSLVIAGLNCLQVPLGTMLGIFTFVVLLRDSVRETYDV